jgi:hypothetical protein
MPLPEGIKFAKSQLTIKWNPVKFRRLAEPGIRTPRRQKYFTVVQPESNAPDLDKSPKIRTHFTARSAYLWWTQFNYLKSRGPLQTCQLIPSRFGISSMPREKLFSDFIEKMLLLMRCDSLSLSPPCLQHDFFNETFPTIPLSFHAIDLTDKNCWVNRAKFSGSALLADVALTTFQCSTMVNNT